MIRILLDTNIIVDVFTKRVPFFSDSYAVMKLCAENKAEGYITASSLTDIYYLIRHETGNTENSKKAVISLLDICEVIDVTSSDCQQAVASGMKDFEDALIDSCAYKEKISYIVTRNIKDFKDSRVKAIKPKELLAVMKEQK